MVPREGEPAAHGPIPAAGPRERAAGFEVGPIDGSRSLTIQRRYLTAWFNHTLRGRPSSLLTRESPAFPEVDFQP